MLLPLALLVVGLVSPTNSRAVAARPTPQELVPAATAEQLIERARALVEAGRAEEAWPLFEQAVAASNGALEARLWLIRGRIARGHVNVALDAVDDLAEAGEAGFALDWLYGLALHARAKQYLTQEVERGLVERNFKDAADFLERATAAEPQRFGDAWLPLAEAAWYGQDNVRARAAAESALARRPRGFDEAFLLGRIALAQYVVTKADAARAVEADAHWQAGVEALGRAIGNAGRPSDARRWSELAQAHLQVAYALVWKERRPEALAAFARAMGADPTVVNYRDLWTHLSPEQVIEALNSGAAAHAELFGADSPQDATLLWWLGWAHFARGEHALAEDAYLRALRKFPDFADARWYIGLARYHRQDFDGAIAAMAAGIARSVEQVVGAARPDARTNLAILDYLVQRCLAAEPPKHLEAAALSELQAGLAPEDARHWSNVGLALYAAGKAVSGPREATRRTELFERALGAYERALELAPDDPGYLNDSAVVLQHGLKRDLDQARARYERAVEHATRELERRDLDPAERRRIEQVAADARANLAEL